MPRTWILLAHRSGARILENPGPGKGLEPVEEIPHPEGRFKNQDFDADKPGRAFDSHGTGRHAMERGHSPVEQAAILFAKRLAERLDQARAAGRYERLVLVAEPRFLGWLREALSPETASRVIASLDKDYAEIEPRALTARLSEELDGVLRL
jgi:protein required for attachment to host cells